MLQFNNKTSAKFQQNLSMEARKQTNNGFWRRKFVEFCKRTDLHGFKYIVMENLTVVERSCWTVAVVLSITFAIYFVYTAFMWYARNPIITVIESTQAAIWDIPFPGITICDLNTVSKKGARVFANNVTLPGNVSAAAVFDAVRFIPLLHSPFVATPQQKQQLLMLQQVIDLNNISLEQLFRILSPSASCSEMLERCMWKNTVYHCDEIFQQIMTMYKLCCAFNYFAVSVPKTPGNKRLVQHSQPRRVASCGYQTALTVLLRTDPADYYAAMMPSQGVLVFIDNAYNMPNQDSPTRLVNPTTEVLISLAPERTYTTSGIRSFTPAKRQCLYHDEIEDGVFRQYSLHNCMEYQRIRLIKKTCECVPYYFPNTEHFRVCNFNDMTCLESVFSSNEADEMLVTRNGFQTPCLPECEHYDYPVQIAMGELATEIKLTGLPFFKNVDLKNCSLLNVFFNDLVSTRFRRDVYFSWQNFTAAFGGLLGLMLGFTLIGFFDMILFCTIRMIYDFFPRKGKESVQPVSEASTKISNWMANSIQIQRWHEKDNLDRNHKTIQSDTIHRYMTSKY